MSLHFNKYLMKQITKLFNETTVMFMSPIQAKDKTVRSQ